MASRSNLVGMAEVVGLAATTYLVYRFYNQAKQTTAPLAQGIAGAWVAATNALAGSFTQSLLGNAVMPDGTLVPMNAIPPANIRGATDAYGNFAVQVLYGGHVYQMQPSNAAGDFPLVLVQ